MKLSEWLPVTRRLGLSLRVMAWLLVLNLVSIFFEGLGVAMLLPIFELLRHGDWSASAELSGRHWEIMREASDYFGIQITLGLLLSVSFGFVLLRQLSKFCYIRSQQVAIRQSTETIRRRIFNGFLRSQTAMQDHARGGEIVADLTVELQRALSSIYSVVRAAGTVVQIAVYVGGLFMLAPAMTLVAISIIAVAGLCLQRLLRKVKEIGAAITDANAQLSAFIVERLTHLRLIRLSNTENAEAAAFSKLSHRHSQEFLRQKLVTTVLSLLTDPIIIALGYAVLLIGGQVFGMSLESLGLMVIVLIRLIPVAQSLISEHNSILGQWPSVQKVDDCLRSLLESREPKGGNIAFDRLDREICYEGVSFSYVTSTIPALNDVSVTVPVHRMTALIGPSGAGKSTFVDLLPRLRDPTGGVIRFDGVPISDFSTASLRAGIAFVPQQPQIFDITAAEHIRYGKEDASDEEVREAARLAGALDFIERLPEGFDTLLGDGGKRLSGGQRQRLDIARALVRHAPILILDEPTSALDAEAEAVFRDALRTLRAETRLTIIVIAHRLSTIADADRIIVLRQGRVEAAGSHSELMAMDSWYAKVYRDQQYRRQPEAERLDYGAGNR